MIIYQNKQDKSGDNKIIQNRMTFAAENFKSEKLSGHLPKKQV